MTRIAAVEDNPDNMMLLQALMEDHYDITEYTNGKDALEGLKKDKPELVLLDISLPEMDGTEVLQHIREDDNLKDLPVIALTAHAMAGDRENYLASGFDGYVSKPITDEQILIDAIEELLKKKKGE